MRHTYVERESNLLGGLDAELDELSKRVVGHLGDRDLLPFVAYSCGDTTRRESDCGHSIVGRRHPEMLRELGPRLMQVAGAAGVPRQEPEHHSIGLIVVEVACPVRHPDLIRELKVLPRKAVVANLGRQHIESDDL